jgi:hypothetical protein
LRSLSERGFFKQKRAREDTGAARRYKDAERREGSLKKLFPQRIYTVFIRPHSFVLYVNIINQKARKCNPFLSFLTQIGKTVIVTEFASGTRLLFGKMTKRKRRKALVIRPAR